MWIGISDENNPYTQRFLGYSVYISNTTKKEDGVLCFKDTIYTRATIPNPTNITCQHHGRYVIYYNNRTNPPYPEGITKTLLMNFVNWRYMVRMWQLQSSVKENRSKAMIKQIHYFICNEQIHFEKVEKLKTCTHSLHQHWYF